MRHASTTDFRANLSKLMDQVNDDHEPMLVTRSGGKPVVVISLDDYEAMDETAYLLATPANRAAISRALEQVESGDLVHRNGDELAASESE